MNVRPKHYEWRQFYDHVVDLSEYSFSWRAMGRRFAASTQLIPRAMNVVRGISSEGSGRIRYHRTIRRLLDCDWSIRQFMDGEAEEIPEFYRSLVRRELGPLWPYLPEGAMNHDVNAFLKAESQKQALPLRSRLVPGSTE